MGSIGARAGSNRPRRGRGSRDASRQACFIRPPGRGRRSPGAGRRGRRSCRVAWSRRLPAFGPISPTRSLPSPVRRRLPPPRSGHARACVRKHPGSSHSRDRRGRRFARPAHGADKCQPRPTLAKLPYGAVASRQGGKEGIYPINVAAAATRDACRQGGCGGTAAIATTTTTTAQARSQQRVERRDSARGHGEEEGIRGAGEGMVVEGGTKGESFCASSVAGIGARRGRERKRRKKVARWEPALTAPAPAARRRGRGRSRRRAGGGSPLRRRSRGAA